MSASAIAGGIVAIAKAIPYVRDIIVIANNRITAYQKAKVSRLYKGKIKELNKITADLGSATTREERREASRKLSNLINPS